MVLSWNHMHSHELSDQNNHKIRFHFFFESWKFLNFFIAADENSIQY